ncbi:MAG TPA: ClpXP protease specificity-enhancing factor SspB [Polyangiaceae bacterium]
MQPTRLPRKKDVALSLLEQATVFVHLDPRGEKVRVPPWFKRQPQLVLQIGLNMPVPIPDLQVDDDGLSCSLSFNRSPHFCVVPWTSVFALVGENGRGMVWPDDVPPEVQAAAEKQAKQAKLAAAPPPPPEPAAAPEPAPKKRRKSRAKTASTEGAAPAAAGKPAAAAKRESARGKKKGATPAVRPAPVPALAPATAASAAAPGTEKLASGPDSKRKRELPPYLRVVK